MKERVLLHTIMRAPWELIPFVLSMFLLVLTLDCYQVTSIISNFLGTDHLVWKYGIASF